MVMASLGCLALTASQCQPLVSEKRQTYPIVACQVPSAAIHSPATAVTHPRVVTAMQGDHSATR